MTIESYKPEDLAKLAEFHDRYSLVAPADPAAEPVPSLDDVDLTIERNAAVKRVEKLLARIAELDAQMGRPSESAAPFLYTPGPWRAESSNWPRLRMKGEWWQVWATGQGDADFIGDVGRTNDPTDAEVARDRANARLFAAAPELLDVALLVLASDGPGADPEGYLWLLAVNAARAIVRKVRGEEATDARS